MSDRFFSESVQYQAVLTNLEKNNGCLKCEICGRNLTSKKECHFDHIIAYAKGGKSTLDNCQILCEKCNLSKSDKDLRYYLLEEKAKRFMSGASIYDDVSYQEADPIDSSVNHESSKMTKEKFDYIVGEFINKHGEIKKVDFTRDRNRLPSIAYISKYYGSIKELKLAFGLKVDKEWNRENIWETLVEYSKVNPGFKQKDLNKSNDLPSLPCILSYYPEYKNFSDIKTALGLELNYQLWTKEMVEVAARNFLKTHTKITQKDLCKENGLPTSRVIYNFFGSLQRFQEEVGSEISEINEYISKEEILSATKRITDKRGNEFKSRSDFLELFPYSLSVVLNRFGSFDEFIKESNISILNAKKAKYTKKEVDDRILLYLKSGNPIPSTSKQLSSLNLPSSSTILRFYDNWKEPFLIFERMLHIAGN